MADVILISGQDQPLGWKARSGVFIRKNRLALIRFGLTAVSVFFILGAIVGHRPWLFLVAVLCASAAVVLAAGVHDLGTTAMDFVVDLFVALAFGIILAKVTEHGGGGGDAAQNIFTTETVVKVSLIFIVMFSAQVVARATRSVVALEEAKTQFNEAKGHFTSAKSDFDSAKEGFEKTKGELALSTEKVEQVTNQLSKQEILLVQARLAGLAAKLLRLREDALLSAGDHHGAAASALDASLSSTRAWIEASTLIRRPDSGGDQNGTTVAWWKMMEIYHREEAFDVSRFEVATNVRNFAYMLIGGIGSFLPRGKHRQLSATGTDLPAPDRLNERQPSPGKLVIAMVTPFSPKDFYNFPNGSGRFRHYHEAEFFGTYRRVLSNILRDRSRIIPLRIFLVREEDSTSGSGNGSLAQSGPAHNGITGDVGGDSDIGWHLEPIAKVAIDCARMHIVPTPFAAPKPTSLFNLPLFAAREAPEQAGGEDAASDSEMMQKLQVLFPPCNHPGKRLPPNVRRFLYAPMYMHFGGLAGWDDREPALVRCVERALCSELDGDRDSFIIDHRSDDAGVMKRARQKWADGESRLQVARTNFENFLNDYVGEDFRTGRLAQYAESVWQSIIHWHFGETPAEDVSEAITYWLEAKEESSTIRDRLIVHLKNGNKEAENELIERQVRNLRAARQRAKHLLDLHDSGAVHPSLEERCNAIADDTLDLAEYCQQIDAGMRYLELFRNSDTPTVIASTGVELGEAENWLHRFLIQCESARLFTQEGHSSPIPIWYLMARDLLGIGHADLPTTHPGPLPNDPNLDLDESTFRQQVKEQFSRRMAICEVSDTVREDMEKQGVSSEFMLIGNLADEPGQGERVDVSHVTWNALIATGLNEPFHTCRVIARFGEIVGDIRPTTDRSHATLDIELFNHATWFAKQWGNGAGEGTEAGGASARALDKFIRILAAERKFLGRHEPL